jgi:hypothetical protein
MNLLERINLPPVASFADFEEGKKVHFTIPIIIKMCLLLYYFTDAFKVFVNFIELITRQIKIIILLII